MNEQKKEVTIIVNGTQKTVSKGKVSYEEIVALAFDPGAIDQPTVAYSHGHSNNQGTLLPGKVAEVVDGMVFDVTPTVKS